VKALLSLKKQYIFWPDAEERSAISAQITVQGFPGCMDFIDIIKVVSQYYVTQDRETYSNQKS
jgi:hypothetical protein